MTTSQLMTTTRRVLLTGCCGGAVLSPLLLGATGCSTRAVEPAGPRAVTTAEAERLAVVRFGNWDRHYGAVSLQLSVESQVLFLRGRADFRAHVGYASVVTDDQPPSYGLLQWTLKRKALLPTASEEVAAQPPSGSWQIEPMARSQPLDRALALVLQLAADRPENPLLLQLNGAQWVGASTVADVAVDLMTVPRSDSDASSSLTYFVDAQGKLRRVSVRTQDPAHPTVIDFGMPRESPVTRLAQLA